MKFRYKNKVTILNNSWANFFFNETWGVVRSYDPRTLEYSVEVEGNPNHCFFFKENNLESLEHYQLREHNGIKK